MSWRIAFLMSCTICSVSAFACGLNVSSTNALPSASPSRSSVCVTQRRQRGLLLLLAGERAAEEVEVGVGERLRQQIGRLVQHVPAQVGLEIVHRADADQPVERAEVVGHRDVDRRQRRRLGGAARLRQLKFGDSACSSLIVIRCCVLAGIAPLDAVEHRRGQRGFDREHRLGVGGGLVGRLAGKREHLLDHRDVLVAQIDRALRRSSGSSRGRAGRGPPDRRWRWRWRRRRDRSARRSGRARGRRRRAGARRGPADRRG